MVAGFLLALAATSTPRAVGDGSEYVHFASRLAAGHVPGPGESRHFIFYSALAAPLLTMGLSGATAFTVVSGIQHRKGPVTSARLRLASPRGKPIIRLPLPQPWVMFVAES
jgi:hypothetical protein